MLLTAYVVVMFVWSHAEASRHTCTGIDVEIEGTDMVGTISKESVLGVLEKYPKRIVGMPSNTVNTLEIAEYLRHFNSFESVECVMTSQSKLKVKVVPVIPEIRVFDGDRSYYVNKDGKIIKSNARFYVDVPVISGHFTDRFTPGDILPVVRFIEADNALKELTGMIVAKDKDNIILVPRIKGHVINLGDTTRLAEKRRAIMTAYHKILPTKGWETYDTISVKFKGQIVATRRDKTPLYPLMVVDEGEDYEEDALAGVGNINEGIKPAATPGDEQPKATAPAEKKEEKKVEKKPSDAGVKKEEVKGTEKKKV